MKTSPLGRAMGPYAPRAPFHPQGPDLTPMVDIAMVILVFFMAAAAIAGPAFFIPAPLAGPGAAAAPDAVLRLDMADGRTRASGLGLEHAPLEAIRDAARNARNNSPASVLVILPARDTPYADVVRAHEICADAGWEKIALGSE